MANLMTATESLTGTEQRIRDGVRQAQSNAEAILAAYTVTAHDLTANENGARLALQFSLGGDVAVVTVEATVSGRPYLSAMVAPQSPYTADDFIEAVWVRKARKANGGN